MRNQTLLTNRSKLECGLEIGPSYNPIAPKKDGWNIKILDHLDSEGLRKKYSAWGVDVSNIEDVDYIANERGIFNAIGERNLFDYIIASHVVEHIPDVVSFFRDCGILLKSGGVLILAVPDKRFCFDYLKPLSTTGQVIQAYLEKKINHSPGTIFDAHALHVKNDGAIVWNGLVDEKKLSHVHTLIEAKKIMDDYISTEKFIDIHAWQFTPKSFLSIINDLIDLGFIDMEVINSSETEGHEFFVTLKNNVCNPE